MRRTRTLARRWLRSIAPLILVCCAAGLSSAQEPMAVLEGRKVHSPGHHLQYLADVDGDLTIKEVSSTALSDRFTSSHAEIPNFGFSTTPYWFRFTLVSRLSSPKKMLLELGYPMLDRVELYISRPDGSFHHMVAGDTFVRGNKAIRYHNFLFPLQMTPGQRQQIYLRIETQGAIQLPLKLWRFESFLEHAKQLHLIYALYFGLLAFVLLYNLFLYASTADRSYLFYVLYILCSLVYQSSFEGLAQEYIWPLWPWWANRVIPLSIYSTVLCTLLFIREFLKLPQTLPLWNRAVTLLIWLELVGVVVAFFAPYNPVVMVGAILVVPCACLAILSAVVAWRAGYTPARLYLAAWIAFLLGGILLALSKLGILPRTALTDNAHLFGFAVNAVLLSFALAERINMIKQEKEEAQADALEAQRLAAERLEQEVGKKTQALQKRSVELSRAYERLAEHDRLKSSFFINVSHEIRSPLTLILAPIEGLLRATDQMVPPAAKQRLRTMEGNVQRLLRLMSQLLDFSRIESGGMDVAYKKVPLNDLVQPIIDAFIPFAQSKGLTLELRAPQQLPGIYTDPAKLDKVVTNLLSNACKFTNAGGTVAVRLSQQEESVSIAVWDTGVGISEQDLPWIFERFHQVDGSATRKYEGTGIGLALSKELMELIGGSLEVKSEEGVGSTFTVILPLGQQHIQHPELLTDDRSIEISRNTAQRSAAANAAALAAETGLVAKAMITDSEVERDQGTPGAETSEESASDRPKVVVVEDNPAMRALVTEICSMEFAVQQAEDGLQGLELIREQRPALVISDVMMPRMDGYEMLRVLRTTAETATIPVLLLTARAGADLRLEGLELGADDYLTKPFLPRELRARARNLVRLQQQEHRLQELNERLQQEVIRQATDLERSRVLRKFLPTDVAEAVLSQQDATEEQLEQKRLNLTVFQLELHGFGELVEQQEPELLAVMLNSYLSEMMEVAFGHGATVDCFDRDRVTGFFGAPRSEGMQQDALRGVQLALDLRDRARMICDRWRELLGAPPPKPTVGLATGHATVGFFGSSRRLDYIAVGGPVEDATAMLSRVAPGGVWCCHETWQLIREEFDGHLEGELPLAHRPQPIRLYLLESRREQP